ncbi:MAG: cell envelope integrity EipB family protein [Acetobacteraceae bacterium]|nr:cell envelope integrity EipB family protein [Acetobacteraceae bacterium]MCX7684552.1 cell envelope integrity EipB family protein [Acetobacteraceae bacterium]MDW8398017.1 cell envelope integrity EipB family protein [Acetobacteraceae bacterium]
MNRRAVLALLALGPAAAGPTAAAQPLAGGPDAMLPHRAAYVLTLERTREGSNIAAARGLMIFEVADACDGWATRQRFTLEITDRDGQQIETTSDYATLEARDGSRLRFSLVQRTNDAETKRVSGEARLAPDGSGLVTYVHPAAREAPLPRGTMLPMGHTVRALAAAARGERVLVAPLFDGTTDTGAQDTTTFILAVLPPERHPRFDSLSALPSARMRVAFFEGGQPQGGAAVADYEMSLRYWSNGVADDLTMEFGEFSLRGRLERLEELPRSC